jgi:hypothetical protein
MSSDNFENIPRTLCLYCDTAFNEGEFRVFCDNECHENYTHQQRAGFLKKIDAILRRNWAILCELLGTNTKMEIDKWELMLMDYNFCYHTHCRITENGTIVYYCYDYSVTVTESICHVWLE